MTLNTFSSKCPVCNQTYVRELFSYRLEQNQTNESPTAESVSREYVFSLFSEEKDYIDACSLICRNCGFIYLDPRPNTSQLSEKYERIAPYLKTRYGNELTAAEQLRAKELYDYVSKLVCVDKSTRILDVGGANGRVMASFIKSGCECSVVDVGVKATIEGVAWLGGNIANLCQDEKFDIIISSHTLEHLIDPVCELNEMRKHLKENGVLYFELPQGCYREVRHERFIDLIGHVNYFSKSSTSVLLKLAGFSVDKIEVKVRRYSEFFIPCIVGIAKLDSGSGFYKKGWGYRWTLIEMNNPYYYFKHVIAALRTYLYQK